MYLVISHFTNNKWTTDYLLEYLKNNKKPYYYLRHPFNFEKDLNYSELIYFNLGDKKVVWKYKKFNNWMLDLLRNFILNFYISIKLLNKYNKIIWFWSFNNVPILYTRLFKKEVNFYWVDYSTKRFENKILNWIYRIFETLSCKYSNKIFSASNRQEEARIKYHHLKKEKSIVINNWINFEVFEKNFNNYEKIWFFYLGSITKQHWIINFINYFYIRNNLQYNLYIVWWWEEENNLKKLITKNKLENKVHYLWNKNKIEIKEILSWINEKLFWIAPYDNKVNDHVYYWDALKIKEYLMFNIPYIVSDILEVQNEFVDFWFIYKKYNNIDFSKLKLYKLNLVKKNIIIKKYDWNNLFSKEF